jgi:hypothetical protein
MRLARSPYRGLDPYASTSSTEELPNTAPLRVRGSCAGVVAALIGGALPAAILHSGPTAWLALVFIAGVLPMGWRCGASIALGGGGIAKGSGTAIAALLWLVALALPEGVFGAAVLFVWGFLPAAAIGAVLGGVLGGVFWQPRRMLESA